MRSAAIIPVQYSKGWRPISQQLICEYPDWKNCQHYMKLKDNAVEITVLCKTQGLKKKKKITRTLVRVFKARLWNWTWELSLRMCSVCTWLCELGPKANTSQITKLEEGCVALLDVQDTMQSFPFLPVTKFLPLAAQTDLRPTKYSQSWEEYANCDVTVSPSGSQVMLSSSVLIQGQRS